MTLAVFRAMLLGLLRDTGALVMAFIMPVAFFIIFAEIFSKGASGEFELRVAVADEVRSPESARLLVAMRRDPAIRSWTAGLSRDQVRDAVRHGDADAGLVVRADGEPLGSAGGFGPPPILVIADPSRAVAGDILNGRLQQAYATALPELLVGGVVDLIENEFTELDPHQRQEVQAGLDQMRERSSRGAQPGWNPADLIEQESVSGHPGVLNYVAYYAGAIAFMFLLLSAAQGALTLLEERDDGLLDRIVAGPGGMAVIINGKFLYLTLLGLAQTAVIFIVAWLVYGVGLPGALFRWFVIATLSSATAAGIALLLVTACKSRAQAQTLSTVVILVMSALGGSMVPRFFMPGWLQNIGWLTPNTWVLEAYSGVLWRNESLRELMFPLAMLLLTGMAAILIAHLLARRLVRD